MPLPTPKTGENHDDFMDRCMADPMMNEDYPDSDQRYAVCESQWDEKEEESDQGDGKEWLRVKASAPIVGVDRQREIIYGYIVAQQGPFKSEGRGEFDVDGLKAIVKLMKAAPSGLKSRFTHPDLSNDGLGKFLGRAKNPRLDTITARDSEGELKTDPITVVRADLHIDPSSHNTPSGDLGRYVMDLAESDPDALSSSLVLRKEDEYRIDKKGVPLKDENGNELPPLWRPIKLHASDVVDTGDAVDGFLSAEGLPDGVVRQAAKLMERQFSGKSRKFIYGHCVGWLNRYLDNRFGGEEPPEPDEPRRLQRFEVSPEVFVTMSSGTFTVTGGALPADAQVVGAGFDQSRGMFSITVQSSEFQPLAAGGSIPVATGPQIARLTVSPDEPYGKTRVIVPVYDSATDEQKNRLRAKLRGGKPK